MNRLAWPLFLVAVAGCATRPDLRGTPVPDATALLAEVDATAARVGRLQALGRARIDGPRGKGNVTVFVAAAAPASVRLEVLDFFGKPSGTLVSDGRRLAMWRSDPGVWQVGPATADSVAELLPIRLAPAALVAMLLGQAPRLADPRPTLAPDADSHAWKVTLREGDRTQELWVDPTRHRVVRSRLTGPEAYALSFDDFEDVHDVPFPRKLQFEAEGQGTVVLRYTDPRLGDAPGEGLFDPTPPPGAPVQPLP